MEPCWARVGGISNKFSNFFKSHFVQPLENQDFCCKQERKK